MKSIYELISSTYRLLHYTFMNSLSGKSEQVSLVQIYDMGTEHLSFFCTYCITNVQLKAISTRHLTGIFTLSRLTNDCRISLFFRYTPTCFISLNGKRSKLSNKLKYSVVQYVPLITIFYLYNKTPNLLIVKILGLN